MPDVNVLVAALRPDHPHHAVLSAWLESAVVEAAAGARFTLMPMVIASFLRLVTSAKIFAKPTTINNSISAADKILAEPGVVLATLGAEWLELRELCAAKNLSSNEVSDAWLAAAASHAAEHRVTFDRDFKKLLPRSHVTVLPATTN